MNVLDLFSGIGGFALAVRRSGFGQVIGYCEIDPFCREVLKARMHDGRLDAAPIHEDVRTFDPEPFRGRVGLICGGFPCQDISAAGKGEGIGGARSGLWREMARIIAGVRPAWLLIENVPALRTRGADRVLADLEEIGYDAWPFVVGAWAVGAPHRRDRVWIVGRLGHPEHDDGRADEPGRGSQGREAARRTGTGAIRVDDPSSTRWPARPGEPQHEWEEPRLTQFEMGRNAPGLPERLVRTSRRNNREALKAFGNSICWPVAEQVLRTVACLAAKEGK